MSTEYCPTSIVDVTGDTTLPAYRGTLFARLDLIDAATITLPDASLWGTIILITVPNPSAAATIATTGSQTINGQSSFPTLSMTGDGYILHSDGSNIFMRNPTMVIYP